MTSSYICDNVILRKHFVYIRALTLGSKHSHVVCDNLHLYAVTLAGVVIEVHILIVVMVIFVHMYVRTYKIVQFKFKKLIVCQFYSNTAIKNVIVHFSERVIHRFLLYSRSMPI